MNISLLNQEIRFLLFNNARISLFTSIFLISGVLQSPANASDYFSPYSLDKRGSNSTFNIDDLSVFSAQEGQLPGKYIVDILVNNEFLGSDEIDFQLDDNNALQPQLTKKQLIDWGVNPDASASLSSLKNFTVINSLTSLIPNSSVSFDFSQQKLKLSIPQISMKSEARGAVSSNLWDQGNTALTLSYGLTGSQTKKENTGYQNSAFLNLRTGLNVGEWRIRNYSIYSQDNNEKHWNSINSYLQRDIISLKSQLILGETSTQGNIFDSVQFTGINLASDDNMLPYSLRGFAPVVQGIAKTNAKVTIRQNDYIIYQTYVSPGLFEIKDLYPTSSSGNLDVSIEEIDGSIQSFVIPFSSVPTMQRDGQYNYSISTGKYKANYIHSKEPNFIQATLSYGLPWNTTLYGGGLYSSNYQSGNIGAAFNLGYVGALSFDVTNAKTNFDVINHSLKYDGKSYRFQYAKSLLRSGTTVTLAGYRYSTDDYYSFSEANDYYQQETHFNKRSRFQANISQTLGSHGSVYLNAYQQDFWGKQGKEKTINAGYNNSWNSINYGLNYSYNNMPGNVHANQIFSLNLSVPFNTIFSNSYVNTNMSTDNDGMNNFQIGLSGQALDGQLDYSIQQSQGNKNQKNSGSASLAYKGSSGSLNAGYSYSDETQRLNYGLQGGAVFHADGLTLSQQLGETIAIVRAPDANAVEISNRIGILTNAKGYAVVPFLTPYQRNKISLNVESLGDNIDVQSNSTTVIPTRGAIVWADFKTHIGWRALIKLNVNGVNVPFGAIVKLENKEDSVSEDINGIVGDNGEVYLNGLPDKGRLLVKWGESNNEQCLADFILPVTTNAPVLKVLSTCLN